MLELDMQRGYTLCNEKLTKLLSIDKETNKFVWLPINSTSVINKALCFCNKTEALNIQKRIADLKQKNLVKSTVVNVARLYSKFI